MSREIDEKVVEMRFDNKDFERNVSTSMSTLEKLKRSLDLNGASKGLENLGRASKNVDMSPLGRSVDAVKTKFSALETVATGALLRIGSCVTDLGLKIASTVTSMSGLSPENIAAGWTKFGEKTTSVATLVAQGYALSEVNDQLERLNWYTDETSYNFTDMVSNISKFTASGQDLTTSVTAMEGIANWAALSGQNATVASRAMYQLSQAMGKGVLKYDDWKSIQNASMDTIEFRNQAVQTAIELGRLKQAGDDAFTTLKGHTFTLAELFTSDAMSRDVWIDSDVMMGTFQKYSAAIDQVYEYAEKHGITASEAIEALGDSVDAFGLKAFKAAQEARTWADVVDSVKDAVSTGWMNTFELIIGNYEEAKTLFTQMANDFYDIFASGAEQRNEVLFEGLSSSYDKFAKSVSDLCEELDGLSDAELAAKGYTREQAEAMAALNEQIKAGNPQIKEYIDSISPPSGRQNLAQSLYNIRDALFLVDKETGKAIGFIAVLKEAWAEIFPPLTGEKIYEITEKIRDFTESLIPTEHTAEQLKSTFKGLFAVLDICKQAFSAVARTISPLLGKIFHFGDSILDATGSIGEWLVGVDEAIKENDTFFQGLQKGVDVIKTIKDALINFAKAVGEKLHLPSFDNLKTGLDGIYNTIKTKFDQGGLERIQDFIDRVKDMDGISLDNIKKALIDFKENVLDYFIDFDSIIGKVKEKLEGFGTKLSSVFHDLCDIANGAKTNATSALEAIVQFCIRAKDKMFEVALEIRSKLADKIGFGEIFAIGLGTAMVVFTKKIADAFKVLSAPFEGIGEVLEGLASAIKAYGMELRSQALKNVAESILMIVGALAVLTLLDQEKLRSAAITLGVIAAALVGLTFLASKMSDMKELVVSSGSLIAFSASILILAGAMKMLSGITFGKTVESFVIIEALMWSMLAISKLMGSKEQVFNSSALSMIGFAVSLKLMVSVIKDIGNLNVDDPLGVIGILLTMIGGLVLLSKTTKDMTFDTGAGILAMVVSLKLLIGSIKTLADMDAAALKKGLSAFAEIFVMFGLMTVATGYAGEHASEAGSAVLKMSAAMILIVASFKMLEKLDQSTLRHSMDVISEMLLVFALVAAASKYAGEHASKAGAMLLMMSGAILILSVVMTLLSHLDPSGLDRALSAITQLLLVFAALVAVTHYAGNTEEIQETLTALTVAIAVLSTSIAMLSLLDPERLKGAGTALGLLVGTFSLLIAATHFAKKAYKEVAFLLLVTTALAGILTALSFVPAQASVQNAAAIGIVLTSLSGTLVILSKAGTLAEGTMKNVWILVGVASAIGAVLTGLSAIPNTQASIQSAGAIGIVLLTLSASLLILGKADSLSEGTMKNVIILAGIAAAIGLVLTGLSAIPNTQASIQSAAAIGIVLASLSASLLILSKAGELAQGTMKNVIILTVITGAIATILGIMGALNAQASIQNAASIGIMLASLSGSLVILSKADSITTSAMSAMATLIPITAGIGLILGVMSALNVEASIKTAASLSIMLKSMSAACVILSKAGPIATSAMAAMALLIPITAGIGLVLGAMSALDVEPSIKTAASLSIMLMSMSAACVILAAAGSFGAAGLIGVGILAVLIAAIGGIMAAICALTKDNPTIEEDLDRAIMVLGKIGTGLGSAIGGIIGGFIGGGALALLSQLGAGLTSFMTNAQGFFDGLNNIPTDALSGIGTLVGVVLALSAQDFISSIPIIGDLFSSGTGSFGTFAEQLNSLGAALSEFAANSNLSDDDVKKIKTSAEGAKALAELADAIPNTGGWVGTVFGDNRLDDFGDQLTAFGEGLKAYSDSVSGDNTLDVDAIESSVGAAQALADLADTIPNSGGIIGVFAGNNNLDTFGTQLATFGEGMKKYSDSVSGENGLDIDAIESSVGAAQALADLADTIPNSGGIIGVFAGNNNLDTFGDQLTAFGEGMKKYSDSVSGENGLDIDAIESSVAAANAMSELAKSVPETTLFSSGGSKLTSFVNSMLPFPTAMKNFGEAAVGVEGYIDPINALADAGSSLATLGNALADIGDVIDFFAAHDNFDAFGTGISSFGKAMKTYGASVSGLDANSDSVQASVIAGNSLVELGNVLSSITEVAEFFDGSIDFDAFAEGIIPFGKAMKEYGKSVSGIDGSAISASATAAQALAEIQAVMSSISEAAEFFADFNAEGFTAGIVPFGEGIKSYGEAVSGIDTASISQSVAALHELAGLQESLSQLQEIVEFFSGSTGFSSFASSTTMFGDGLGSFGDALSGVDLSSITGELPELGTDLSSFGGDLTGVNLSSAAKNLPGLGDGISSFGDAVTGIDLSKLGSNLPALGQGISDYSDEVSGVNVNGLNSDLGNFGSGLVAFGKSMADYSDAMKNVDSEITGKTENAVQALTTLADGLPDIGGLDVWMNGDSGLSSFGETLTVFGDQLSVFYSQLEKVDVSKLSELVSEMTSMSEIDSGAMSGLGEALKSVASSGIADFISVFSESGDRVASAVRDMLTSVGNTIRDNRDTVKSAMEGVMTALTGVVKQKSYEVSASASAMMRSVAIAIQSYSGSVRSAAQTVMFGAISAISGYYNQFYSAGANAGRGFVQGLESKIGAARQVGSQMGKAAVKGAENALDEHSPSKEFMRVGEYSGEGFVIGMGKQLKAVTRAGERMGQAALDGTSDALDSHSPSIEYEYKGEDTGEGLIIGMDGMAGAVTAAGERMGQAALDGTGNAINADSITGIVTDFLDQAGANTAGMNYDWLNFGGSAAAAAAAEAPLQAEATAIGQVTAGYQMAAEAKQDYYNLEPSASASTKAWIGTGYPSEEYLYLMKHLGEGLAIGFKGGIVNAEDAISESIGEVLSMAGSGIDVWEDWLDEKKYYNKISLKDELSGWEKLQQQYRAGTEEREKIDREVYRVQNELVASTYQSSLDWMETEKYYNRLSTRDELSVYETMQKRYMEGSEERIEIDKKVYSLRNQLVDEAYENSMNWLEQEKYYNRLTLAEELAGYKRVQSRYAKGTEERKKMDREIYRVEQEIYEAQKQYIEDIKNVQEEADRKREEAEKEYRDNCAATTEKLKSDIKSLNDTYQNALDSRANSLYQSYGLFDEVKEREEVSGAKLLDNLQGQVEEFGEWQRTLDKLSARGVDSELIDELSQMGPQAISQIKALESMSDSELDRYVSLWSIKHALARHQAINELEGLRSDTDEQILKLYDDAAADLENYAQLWDTKLNEIQEDSNKQMRELRESFGKKVGLIKTDTEAELQEMVDASQKILTEAGWSETGKRIVDGLRTGIADERSNLLDTLTRLALDSVAAVKTTLDINSPSRVFRELGNFTGLGYVIGLTDYADKSYEAGSTVAEYAKDGLSDAMQTVSAYVNGDLDDQPIIRPVLDLSDVANGVDEIDTLFYNRGLFALAGQTSFGFSANARDNGMTINVDTDSVVRELRDLRGEMAEMADRMARMQVVLDTGTLVGETASLMDAALGQRQTYSGRGN